MVGYVLMKQDIERRVVGASRDWEKDQEKTDLRKRWQIIREDLPDECGVIEDALGVMPVPSLDDVPLERAVNYAARDADATLRVYPKLLARVKAMGLYQCYLMDISTVPMCERMQANGIRISTRHFQELEKYLNVKMVDEVSALFRWTRDRNFNPNSPLQVAELFKKLHITTTKKTPTGMVSTNDKVLEGFRNSHPAIPHIIQYRELGTMRDDFCRKMIRMVSPDGRIHGTIRITRVSSGRLSMSSPNLQGIPVRTPLGKRIREGFIPGPGNVLASWDLDQIEMREMAHQSKDPVMCKIFRDGGRDIHRETAAMMYGKDPRDVSSTERYAAKRIGFGVITGITNLGLLDQMRLAGAEGWDEKTSQCAIDDYFKVYRSIPAYMDACRAEARRNGFVRDRWGRIRYLPGVYSDIARIRQEALRQSHSFKISASAQGIIKRAMAGIWQWLRECWAEKLTIEPLLQIHDELLFELDPGIWEIVNPAIVDMLCNTTPLIVPIKAKGSMGANWGALKE